MGNKMESKRQNLYRIWFRRVAGIVVTVCIFSGICNVLNYMYFQGDEWGRNMWHHFYQDEGKIDNVYIGSSHVHCDINPMQLDEMNGQYNFNLASNSQLLNGSFYVLKEADRDNQLSHVYIELYYILHSRNELDGKEAIAGGSGNNWCNYDYMKISRNKIAYMLDTTEVEKYVDMLFPFCRYRAELNNWDYIREVMENKNSNDYLSYQNHYEYDGERGYDEHMRQGYFFSTREVLDEEKIFMQNMVLGENPVSKKSEKYLRQIINYCQERNIPITLFISPIMDLQLISTENYDCYIDQVRKIAEECRVEFYDFNLAKTEYLPIQEGKYFRDIGHLNGAGASMFTSFFYEVVSGDKTTNEKFFYDSYAEKLEMQPPEVYGLYYSDLKMEEESLENARTFWIASNRETEMEYRIIMTLNDSGQYMIQDFAENKIFTVSLFEHGICTIVARVKENPDDVQTLEVSY